MIKLKIMFAKFNSETEQSNAGPTKVLSGKEHFNKSLKEEEAKDILKDYPMPNYPAIKVPRFGKEVRKQLRSKGRNPHFGQ